MKRPNECKAPGNVWFETRDMAMRNTFRKEDAGLGKWYVWRCYDHFHIRPKRRP